MQRTDPLISFDWQNSTPVASGPSEHFLVRWSGYITVPTTGAYQFGTNADDGTTVTINSNVVESRWVDHTASDDWGGAVNLTAGQTLPITIEAPDADDIWNAALLKAQYPISYADAFAAALAQKYACPLVTGDPEFRSIGLLDIDWIGKP